MAADWRLSQLVSFWTCVHFIYFLHMTNSAITPVDNSALLAEFSGGSNSDVSMMIGIGLVKDSEAVFFQYLGEEQTPSALMMPSGRPLTRLANVTLAGIDIAEEVGEFKSTKLNLFLQSSQGRVVMLTLVLLPFGLNACLTALWVCITAMTSILLCSLTAGRVPAKCVLALLLFAVKVLRSLTKSCTTC